MITTEIIADSLNPMGNRLTTFILRYPRFIHAEFMTHRMFSRNASSSRAVPVSKTIEEAEFAPALPIYWGKNQKGMQSFEELDGDFKQEAENIWHQARFYAVETAKKLSVVGLHKQYINRILEPFTHITVICTATDYGNFFNLRCDENAMPEIQELAFQMAEKYYANQPIQLKRGEWHLPFCDKYAENLTLEQKKKVCVARCARVSYLTFDGDISYEKDEKLFEQLSTSGHWSAFEHAAKMMRSNIRYGNFVGFKQYRKFFADENRKKFIFKKRGVK